VKNPRGGDKRAGLFNGGGESKGVGRPLQKPSRRISRTRGREFFVRLEGPWEVGENPERPLGKEKHPGIEQLSERGIESRVARERRTTERIEGKM